MIEHDKVDVVIVGSGAAGSVYGAILAEGGKGVLVLEKGPARKLGDLYSSQIWARRLKWGAPHVIEEGKNSIWFNFNAGHGFGGASIHHYGVWPRYHPEDFKEKSLFGKSLDWPFDYDVLRPYYDQVQLDVGISGDAELEKWRPEGEPYPLPPIRITEHGRTIAKGFEAMGMHTSPIPIAVLSETYKGREACIWDGWCDAGCPTGALANPLVTYLPRATAKGVKMRAGCYVTRVMTDQAGQKATGVEYYDQAGERHFEPADMIILSAFAIENPRILLNSATDKHPNGLANSSGLLGKYLMSHPAVSIYGLFDHDMENYIGATGGQLFNQDHFDKNSTPGVFGSRQWEMGLALKPNDLLGIAMSRPDIYGAELDEFMKQGAMGMGSMVGVCEELPDMENRVELSSQKDKFGFPLARVVHTTGKDGTALLLQTMKEGVEIFKAAGAKEAWHGPQGGQHLMGGAIMGETAESSVTDKNSHTHDIPNLVVGGSSVFPTSSCVNSTFTIHAVAMKSAKHILENWSEYT